VHYIVGVILPFQYEGEKLHEAIATILAPWDEGDHLVDAVDELDGTVYQHNPNGRWDWWQLGGRWTGVWSAGYDPRKDPANRETCWLCGGTGLRSDERGNAWRAKNPSYTCNGCGYGEDATPGIKLKHPNVWVKHPELDVVPVAALLKADEEKLPYAIAAAPDVWLERKTWDGENFRECPDWPTVARSALEVRRECWIAVVDIHC
jgi:hypothetical protein